MRRAQAPSHGCQLSHIKPPLSLQRERRSGREQRDSEQAVPADRDLLEAEQPEAVDCARRRHSLRDRRGLRHRPGPAKCQRGEQGPSPDSHRRRVGPDVSGSPRGPAGRWRVGGGGPQLDQRSHDAGPGTARVDTARPVAAGGVAHGRVDPGRRAHTSAATGRRTSATASTTRSGAARRRRLDRGRLLSPISTTRLCICRFPANPPP